jgi:Peptidase_C39 like family
MNIRRFASTLAVASLISGSGIVLDLASSFTPLAQQAQAAYYQNCAFTGSIAFSPTNVRSQTNTSASIVKKFWNVGEQVKFSSFDYGQSIADAWTGQPDNMWFKLADGSGYIASAVVHGYPPTSKCGRLPMTTTEANPFFKMQFSDPKYNPDGPSFSANCGPASVAMVLAALGREPSGLTIQKSIDRASDLMKRSRTASTTTWAQLQAGIINAGGSPQDIDSWAGLDQALSQGKPVILNGYYGQNWRNQFPARTGNGATAHINAALGKTSDGRYIIADPMHTGGTVAMNKSQLAVFFSLQTQNGNPWGIVAAGL